MVRDEDMLKAVNHNSHNTDHYHLLTFFADRLRCHFQPPLMSIVIESLSKREEDLEAKVSSHSIF